MIYKQGSENKKLWLMLFLFRFEFRDLLMKLGELLNILQKH